MRKAPKKVTYHQRRISQILGVILVLTTCQQAWALRAELEVVHYFVFAGLAAAYAATAYIFSRKTHA